MAEFFFADKYVLDDGTSRDFYVAFMKGLVHKTNNLVGVVQGFGSLVLMENNLDREVRENITQMDSAARAMTELNKKVLVATGCGKLDIGEVNLPDIFKFQEQKAKSIGAGLGVNLKFQVAPNLPKVMMDTPKFSEVFENLIKNAVESAATTPGKVVAVEVYGPGTATPSGYVDLFIRNTSANIPAAKMPELFEGFYSSKGNHHFGLGLTIAAILCGQMKIRLGLKNENNVMTTWLSIPVAK
jgi:signal transduction histidine kinase